jgi:hypothetical protein
MVGLATMTASAGTLAQALRGGGTSVCADFTGLSMLIGFAGREV